MGVDEVTRSAEATIKGFLYQFLKTAISILEASDEAVIGVEGVVEDVDVLEDGVLTAIQCKYHESVDNFTDSNIFKPVLMMAEHRSKNVGASVRYRIFCHFPEEAVGRRALSAGQLTAALATANVTLKKVVARIAQPFDQADFLSVVDLEFGPSLTELETDLKTALEGLAIDGADVSSLLLPNAIQKVIDLAVQTDVDARKVSRAVFVEHLKRAHSTSVTRWTLALLGRAGVLKAKREQLRGGLGRNSRNRMFVFQPTAVENFSDGIVGFIKDFVDHYYTKELHLEPPTVLIRGDVAFVNDVEQRLYAKDILVNRGFVGGVFHEAAFYKKPMVVKRSGGTVHEREFRLRLACWEHAKDTLSSVAPDDLFIISDDVLFDSPLPDVRMERVGVRTLTELEYLLRLRNNHA